jgi:hypothetical protein
VVRAITSTSQGEVNTNCSRGTIHMAAKVVAIILWLKFCQLVFLPAMVSIVFSWIMKHGLLIVFFADHEA